MHWTWKQTALAVTGKVNFDSKNKRQFEHLYMLLEDDVAGMFPPSSLSHFVHIPNGTD